MVNPDTRFRILAVDDSEDILSLLQVTLGKDYDVKTATDARTALKAAFEKPRPDLILLDVEMPGPSGYDVCRAMKASPALADIPVIFLTSRDEARDVVQGFQLGAIDYFSKPINPPVLLARIRAHVELITRRGLQDQLIRERTTQLEQTRLQLIRRLGRAMEYHETSAVGNRVVRLGHYARALAGASGAKPELCDLLMKAAPLHDIGKLGVPAQILRKTEKLTAPERAQMQRHPEIGAEIIGEHDDPLLKLARTLALTHHERWDGTGYPSGISGNDIPWPGRVMALVDAFEGMTATQFHREPIPLQLATDEILHGSGKQFDPRMVDAFRKCLIEFRKVKETYSDSLGDMLDLDFSSLAPPPPTAARVPTAPVVQAAAAFAATTAQREPAETTALQQMRESDAARATQLAGEQAKLKVERDLLSTATKDISTQQASRKRAEAAAAREAEVLSLNKRRITEEAAAAQAARDAAKAEAEATSIATQAEQEKAKALVETEKRLAQEQALAVAAGERQKAEAALATTAASLAARHTEALETAGRRLAEEREANRLAQERAKAELAAADIARKAAETQAQLLTETEARIQAEGAAAQAAVEKGKAGQAAVKSAEALARAEEEARAAADKRKAADDLASAEATALEASRQRAAGDQAAAQAATDRARAEEEATRLACKAAEASAASLASAQARAKSEEALAGAARERVGAEAQASAAGLLASAAENVPRSRTTGPGTPPAASSSRRATLFAAALLTAAGAAAFYWSEVETPPPAPRAPVATEPKPIAGLSEGPPLQLRLDTDVAKLAPKEAAK